MSRYFSSFFIAFSFYALFGIGIFYSFENNKIIIKEVKQIQTLSLNHIEIKPMEKEVVEEKIVERDIQDKRIEEKIEKKEELLIEQKIVKIPKPIKKIEKKKIIEKKETVNKAIKEVKETQNPIKENIVVEKMIQKNIQKEEIPQKEVIDNKKAYLDKHLIQIRNLINQNVKYPKRARKLSIQGIVLVKFKITKNGEVENITILDGHKFLQSATIEAITEASKNFPKTNQSIEIQIPIEYKLI